MREGQSILPLTLREVGYAAGGRTLLDRVSFTVEAGRKVVVIGPNGAGKSLTLRLCHGLIAPTSGSVAFARPEEAARRRRHAMVFQRPVLLRRSARPNILHALSLAGIARAPRAGLADDALRRFGLSDIAGSPARVLSGGEQQRLAMARAWALTPDILFLDEPTSALDPGATRAIESMIAAFHARGVAILMTTHDLGQARRIADDIVFLHAGRVVEAGPAQAFFARPQTEEARAFLAGELLW
jgi:tungstate transport system ATP-binding protein